MKNALEAIHNSTSPLSKLSLKVLSEMKNDGLIREYLVKPGDSLNISASTSNDSFYLAYGDVDVIENNKIIDQLNDAEPKRRPIHLINFQNISFFARRDSALIRVNQEHLDYFICWKTMNHEEKKPRKETPITVREALSRMIQPTIFISLPIENIHRIIQKMHILTVSKGTEVITQGDPADNFYIIADGEAEVWQTDDGDNWKKVNHLYVGNHFGQDALLVEGAKRNASVRMNQDSTLLVLNGEDFNTLISEPLIHEIRPQQARELMSMKNARLLDVRCTEETDFNRLPNSRHIPLPELRDRLSEIEPDKTYIIYDDTGKCSTVAAMILQQNSVQAYSLVVDKGQKPENLLATH